MRFDNVDELELFLKDNGFSKVSVKSKHWVMCCCPFHNDSNPSFGINVMTLKGHCFLCGWFEWNEILNQMGLPVDGDLDTIDAMTGVAWRAVKDKLDFKNRNKNEIKRFRLPIESYDIMNVSDRNYYNYLFNRGFDSKILLDFDIKVCFAKGSKYYHRIIFPVNDIKSKLVFFDARSINPIEKKKKYIRPHGSPVPYCLGGIDKVYEHNSNKVVIVEGYLDMLKLWQFGVPSVCTFSSTLHDTQIKMLIQKQLDYVIVGYDNDEPGNKATYGYKNKKGDFVNGAMQKLNGCGSRIFRLRMPINSDPGDFRSKEHFFQWNKFILNLN